MSTFKKGDRVNTPKGLGYVIYVRMAPPEYTKPAAISVRLDYRTHDPVYVGTIFCASENAVVPA